MTNFDRIKAMSVEEMVELLNNHNDPCKFCVRCDEDYCRSDESGYCEEHIEKWLESEVEGENEKENKEVDQLSQGFLKFKTGDYAKIVDNRSGHQFKIGTIVKLEKQDTGYKAFANGDYWWVQDSELTEINDDNLVKEMVGDAE